MLGTNPQYFGTFFYKRVPNKENVKLAVQCFRHVKSFLSASEGTADDHDGILDNPDPTFNLDGTATDRNLVDCNGCLQLQTSAMKGLVQLSHHTGWKNTLQQWLRHRLLGCWHQILMFYRCGLFLKRIRFAGTYKWIIQEEASCHHCPLCQGWLVPRRCRN